MLRQRIFFILILAITLIGFTACSGSTGPAETTIIRIAALPVLDTLPIYVAEQEGTLWKIIML